jgi:hypothetical protein
MGLIEKSIVRNVTGISNEEKQRIMDFLQGAVYCWCKNRKDEWFSLRDLMGGDNYYWEETPLLPLYNKHKIKSSEPVKEAGKDGGWLLKAVINKDKRQFETKKEALIRKYRWKFNDADNT